MNFKKFNLLFFILFATATGYAQLPDGKKVTLGTRSGNDTIPLVNLPAINVFGAIDPMAAERMKQYLKLRRDVIKAYPYAQLAKIKLKEINDHAATLKTQKERKKYIKATEKELKSQFEKDLKNLTYTQGRILIRLIDRETGSTSYALVKELRGSLQAFFWQGLARLFGSNLKAEYDSDGKDALIEGIVKSIEKGDIAVRKL